VCSVVHFSHAESLRPVVGAGELVPVVDTAIRTTLCGAVVLNTETVVPVYNRTVHVTDTLKRHR